MKMLFWGRFWWDKAFSSWELADLVIFIDLKKKYSGTRLGWTELLGQGWLSFAFAYPHLCVVGYQREFFSRNMWFVHDIKEYY